MIKRLTTQKERDKLKSLNIKEFKGKNPNTLSQIEINKLVIKLAQKFGIL